MIIGINRNNIFMLQPYDLAVCLLCHEVSGLDSGLMLNTLILQYIVDCLFCNFT